MPPAKFIVLEGLDGCGTTTQINLLYNRLKQAKISCEKTFEPTDHQIGKLIKAVLTKKMRISPEGLQLLFCADRAHHLQNVILPPLKKGNWVLCDRYYYSTIAYGSLSADIKWLRQLNKYFFKPDLTIYIKVPPKVCIERISVRGKKSELFEQLRKLKKIEKVYDQLAKTSREMVVIDGDRSIEENAELIWGMVRRKFNFPWRSSLSNTHLYDKIIPVL